MEFFKAKHARLMAQRADRRALAPLRGARGLPTPLGRVFQTVAPPFAQDLDGVVCARARRTDAEREGGQGEGEREAGLDVLRGRGSAT